MSIPHSSHDHPGPSTSLRTELSVWEDWSGRGSHVDFLKEETVPLEKGRSLGRGRNGPVYETFCKGVALAWKQRLYRYKITPKERREIDILKKLDHRHIIKLVGTYTHLNHLGILLWPVAVCDLATFFDDMELLHHSERRPELEDNWEAVSGRLDALGIVGYDTELWPSTACKRLLRLLGCLASAVDYLHSQHIRHKDLKPLNILLSKDSVWLTDFDVSTDFSNLSSSSTDNGERGTPKYFAPEVANHEKNGRPADIFSLGCIFLEIVTVGLGGCLESQRLLRPQRGQSFHANLASTTLWFKYLYELGNDMYELSRINALLRKMLSHDPLQRPSASVVFDSLRKFNPSPESPYGKTHRFHGICCNDPVEQRTQDSLLRSGFRSHSGPFGEEISHNLQANVSASTKEEAVVQVANSFHHWGIQNLDRQATWEELTERPVRHQTETAWSSGEAIGLGASSAAEKKLEDHERREAADHRLNEVQQSLTTERPHLQLNTTSSRIQLLQQRKTEPTFDWGSALKTPPDLYRTFSEETKLTNAPSRSTDVQPSTFDQTSGAITLSPPGTHGPSDHQLENGNHRPGFHCLEPGCNSSARFMTHGDLARHILQMH